MAMGVRDRINRYRQSGGAADLVRVEVLVPKSSRDEILASASSLRATHRQKNDRLRLHLDGVLQQYGTRILDNVDLSRVADVCEKSKIAANVLIERGDARAYVIGRRLLAEAGG
jgi:hypothetical protein